MSEPGKGCLVEIEYRFEAARPEVFAAFTQADQLEHWVWGRPASEVDCELQLEVGAPYCFALTQVSPDGSEQRFRMLGLFTEIQAPSVLSYTLHWDAPVGYNEDGRQCIDEFVRILFEEEAGGTGLLYRHFGVPDPDSAREHERSIRATFDLLSRRLGTSDVSESRLP